MNEGIFVLQNIVERIRNSFHGADSAVDILVNSKEFANDDNKYAIAVSLMNNSAIYISFAQNFYQQNEILSGFAEIENYFRTFFDLQFELMEAVKNKEDNLSWFVSRHSIFVQAKKEIESLINRENENYKLIREQHKKNAEDFKQNAHKLFTKR
ncbi:hypothetical protein [Sporosarcina sp. UB5]|uniref:hypothetical protein n=1 Tax=Sporosarcina sp. UB5 TaxID=3047463 RepID=UPI003D7BC35C